MAVQCLEFDWDPAKARRNDAKHGVRFDEALTVFSDPFALTMFDEDHGDEEERWITLGTANDGRLLVVIHTHDDIDETRAVVRLISARPATKREARQYRDGEAP
jgi:uncharacterized DUF497 family protein